MTSFYSSTFADILLNFKIQVWWPNQIQRQTCHLSFKLFLRQVKALWSNLALKSEDCQFIQSRIGRTVLLSARFLLQSTRQGGNSWPFHSHTSFYFPVQPSCLQKIPTQEQVLSALTALWEDFLDLVKILSKF